MDTGSLFLILGLLILVGLFVSRPFFIHKATSVSKQDYQRSILLANKERLISALEEIDFDFKLGKIPQEDYPAQRTHLLNQAATILSQLDALQEETQANSPSHPRIAGAANRRTESQSTSKRPRKRRLPANVSGDDELEAMIAARRRERSEKAAGFCHHCGKPIQLSDQYCPRCGTLLNSNPEANS
jgi:rubrerythrin